MTETCTKKLDNPLARTTFCLLGLPFDALDLRGARNRILEAIDTRTPCFLSTPNVNWLTTSEDTPDFLESVINSDCSLADGMPLIWIAKALKIPLPERTAGSDLISSLENCDRDKKIRVFFFGGEDNVAQIACDKINQTQSSLVAVGGYSPGFGCIEEMSDNHIIELINQNKPDLIVVSLGARKGQQWIEANRHKLDAPVISHLGAVVNFYAGSVKRSPSWMANSGLEWLWRIYQEPKLYVRYAKDALFLLKQLFQRIIPYYIFLNTTAKRLERHTGSVISTHNPSSVTLVCTGSLSKNNIDLIQSATANTCLENKDIYVDLSGTNYIDSAFGGKILALKNICNRHRKTLKLVNASPQVKRICYYLGIKYPLVS